MKFSGGGPPQEDLVRAAWPLAVGKKIAAHTRAVSLAGGRLRVEVDDEIWQGHLITLAGQILKSLRDIVRPEAVASLEFRLRIPRLPPQLAAARQGASDEADQIADPVFRHLYKSSRKRSGA